MKIFIYWDRMRINLCEAKYLRNRIVFSYFFESQIWFFCETAFPRVGGFIRKEFCELMFISRNIFGHPRKLLLWLCDRFGFLGRLFSFPCCPQNQSYSLMWCKAFPSMWKHWFFIIFYHNDFGILWGHIISFAFRSPKLVGHPQALELIHDPQNLLVLHRPTGHRAEVRQTGSSRHFRCVWELKQIFMSATLDLRIPVGHTET